jgi:hypothetical protein
MILRRLEVTKLPNRGQYGIDDIIGISTQPDNCLKLIASQAAHHQAAPINRV